MIVSRHLILFFTHLSIISNDVIFMLLFILYTLFRFCFTPHLSYYFWEFTEWSLLCNWSFNLLLLNVRKLFFEIIIIAWKRPFCFWLLQNTFWWSIHNFNLFNFPNFIRWAGARIVLSLFVHFSFFNFWLSFHNIFCCSSSSRSLSSVMNIRRFSIFRTHLIATSIRFLIDFQNQFINNIIQIWLFAFLRMIIYKLIQWWDLTKSSRLDNISFAKL